MHRLLVDTASLESEAPVLSSEAAAHLRVVRPKSGERVELFDGKGRTDEKVPITKTMMSETVCVPFKYQVMTPEGAVVSETEMELVGGIVGVQEDSATFTLSPKIGWFVRTAEPEAESVAPMPLIRASRGRAITLP